MRVFTYHAKAAIDFDINALVDHLVSQEEYDLKAIRRYYEEDLRRRLSSLGIDFSHPTFPFSPGTKCEILISESRKILLQLRIVTHFEYKFELLEIKIVSENTDEFVLLKDLIQNFRGVKELSQGTLAEKKEIERFNKEFRLSPHGKKLVDKKYENVFPILYDDKIREMLFNIIDTFAGVPLTVDIFEKFSKSLKDKKTADRIVKNSTLISKDYMITCRECGSFSSLAFEKKSQAEETLQKAQYICPNCTRDNPEIIETFRVRKEAIQGLKEGLWLEKFVDHTLREETENVWSGVTVDTIELDNVAILNERTYLVECKDTSFGQNDFYILMEKARKVDANVVIVVTTREVHQNVDSAIKKYQEEGEREIHVIESGKIKKISSKFKDLMKKRREEYISEILVTDIGPSSYELLRRSMIRRSRSLSI